MPSLRATSTVSMAPAIGLWVYEHGGWRTLCLEAAGLSLGMFTIAWTLLPKDPPHAATRAVLDAMTDIGARNIQFVREFIATEGYKIVGEDESDVAQGKISVTSPIARALIGKVLAHRKR